MRRPSKTFLIITAVVLLVGAAVGVLFLGNPQWCKHLYVLQWRIYQQEPEMPDDFTGIWTEWERDGNLWSQQTFRNGKAHGLCTCWWPSGEKFSEGRFENGRPVGVHLDYFDPETGSTGIECKTEWNGATMHSHYYDTTGMVRLDFILDKENRLRIAKKISADGMHVITKTTQTGEDGGVVLEQTVTNTLDGSNNLLHGIGEELAEP